MKKLSILAVSLLAVSTISAQTPPDELLRTIERNNTTLKALRQNTQAQKLENRKGIQLADPEVEYGYGWGSPRSVGSKQDLTVRQSFDLSTVFGVRQRVAREQNSLVDTDYRARRVEILLQAEQTLISLAYYNRLCTELTQRNVLAQRVAESYAKRLADGDANILEYNKAKLNFTASQGALRLAQLEQRALQGELAQLNGGAPLEYSATEFTALQLPSQFEEWYSAMIEITPSMQYALGSVALSRSQLSLSRSRNLPQLSAGYALEKTLGQNFQGVTVGMSIPLWANRNNVKHARAAVAAAESQLSDTQVTLRSQLQILYEKCVGARALADDYMRALTQADNSPMLQKALDAGEISLLDYIVEMGLYYDALENALQARRDYLLSLAQLRAVEL